MTTLGCLALLGACSKAEFEPDSGSGGSGGTIDGTGGGAIVSGTGGDSMDLAPDEAQVIDSGDQGEIDSTAVDVPIDQQGVTDAGMDADSALDVVPEAPVDAPTGIMPTVLGQILISEVMNDSSVLSDDFGEWFEVFNPSTDTNFDLLGCTLGDSNNVVTITKSIVMLPGSFHTLARSNMEFMSDFVYLLVKLDNQAPDTMTVKCANTLIDTFTYNPQFGQSGHSFSVDPLHLHVGENNVTGNFCVSNVPYHTVGGVTDFGTPNLPNPPCPAGNF